MIIVFRDCSNSNFLLLTVYRNYLIWVILLLDYLKDKSQKSGIPDWWNSNKTSLLVFVIRCNTNWDPTNYQITNTFSGSRSWCASVCKYSNVDSNPGYSCGIFISVSTHFYPLQAWVLSKEKASARRLWLSRNYSGRSMMLRWMKSSAFFAR